MNGRLKVLMLLVVSAVALYARATWSYTPDQATAGRAAYEQNCSTCHGTSLRQLPEALLAGREFVAKWGDRGANDLITQMRSSMPPTSPGGLSEGTYVSIAAYLLQANGAGADGQALTARTTTNVNTLLAARGATPTPAAGASPGGRTGVTVAGTVPNFVPVTDAMLRAPKPEDWLMLRHDYAATSYSPLTQITAANASRLELVWTWPMREGGTNQPAPVVYNGTMFLANTGGSFRR